MNTSMLTPLVFGFLAMLSYAKKAPKKPEGKTPKKGWLLLLPLVLCHPLYLSPAWYFCKTNEWGDSAGVNVWQVSLIHFSGLLLAIAVARLCIFYGAHKIRRGQWTFIDALQAFAFGNATCLFALPALGLWVIPVEGNIAAFLNVPLNIATILLVTPFALFMQGHVLRNAPKDLDPEAPPVPSGN